MGLYNGFFVYDALETMYDDSTGDFSTLPYQFNDGRMCYTGVAPDLLGL